MNQNLDGTLPSTSRVVNLTSSKNGSPTMGLNLSLLSEKHPLNGFFSEISTVISLKSLTQTGFQIPPPHPESEQGYGTPNETIHPFKETKSVTVRALSISNGTTRPGNPDLIQDSQITMPAHPDHI